MHCAFPTVAESTTNRYDTMNDGTGLDTERGGWLLLRWCVIQHSKSGQPALVQITIEVTCTCSKHCDEAVSAAHVFLEKRSASLATILHSSLLPQSRGIR